jgi:hypothetical protein
LSARMLRRNLMYSSLWNLIISSWVALWGRCKAKKGSVFHTTITTLQTALGSQHTPTQERLLGGKETNCSKEVPISWTLTMQTYIVAFVCYNLTCCQGEYCAGNGCNHHCGIWSFPQHTLSGVAEIQASTSSIIHASIITISYTYTLEN